MNLSVQTAKHLRDVYFGGNWTVTNIKDSLKDVTWSQANVKVYSFNTILTLVHHMHYYIREVSKVLQGKKLKAKDKYSFEHATITSQKDWDEFLDNVWVEAENFAKLIEKLPEHMFWEDFSDKKYGNYFRNINGIIEHIHYHLGQLVLIKKIILQSKTI